MAKESMAQLRDRVRKQVAQAHTQPETATSDMSSPQPEKATDTLPQQTTENQETPEGREAHINSSGTKRQKRRRTRWTNLYPNAMPFQTSVYLTEEDLVLIKSLRLKLHLAREWMVIKYALEELDKNLEAYKIKQL